MHSIEGKTHNSLVRLGGLIYVKFPSGFEKENMGEYRVISVEHCVDRDDYYNHFVAVPLGMEYTLYEPITVAYPEIAEVVANDDPKKQGRIQVRFFWQKTLGEQTPWLRVQTPDAGVLTDKSGNRGFQFIPEVGDQVMVSFEQGNPHRPYVSGSMYHGKNAKEVSNNVRSITTKSGSTIVFDDNDGKERITIKDKNGNIILLDTKAKSIEITAPENIVMKAKNITLEAEARIEAKAKENITATAEKELIFSANNEGVIQTKKGFTVKTGDDITLKSEGAMNASVRRDIALKANGNVSLESSGNTKVKGSTTQVSGNTVSLEGSSKKVQVS